MNENYLDILNMKLSGTQVTIKGVEGLEETGGFYNFVEVSM